jgi:hypothetical protein
VYIHVPKEKRTKLEPSGKKGTFIGYSETSKAYRIYIPRQRQIEISRDVTFDEEATFRKSRESHMDEDKEEQEAPRDAVMIDSTPEECNVPEPNFLLGTLIVHCFLCLFMCFQVCYRTIIKIPSHKSPSIRKSWFYNQ